MRRTALLWVSVLLAGCSNGGPNATEGDPFGDIDAGPVASDKGVIRGVVFDASVAPIEGATVRLQAGGETTSNQEGAFLLKDIEPGLHFLSISKAGYSSVQQSAEVVAGVKSPPVVKVQLQQMPGTEPRALTFQDVGYITCGWGVPITYGYCGEHLGTEDDFHLEYGVEGTPDWIQVEIIWQSSQAATANLYMIQAICPPDEHGICPGGTPFEGDAPYRWDEGTYESPAIMRSPAKYTHEAVAYHNLESMDGWLVGVDVSADGPALATGVTIEQEFTGYVTMFWNIDPAEDWTFYEQGEYPVGG